MPWRRDLGGARVQLELAEALQALGHEVEKFDYWDAFPKAGSSKLAKLIRPSFASKAKAYVQKNAHRFDIIDAHQGNLPFSKQELGVQSLVVTRSVGLYVFYEQFAKSEAANSPLKVKTRIKNWLMFMQRKQQSFYNFKSLHTCDLINVPNLDELAYLRDCLGLGDKCVVLPFGQTEKQQQALTQVSQSTIERLRNQQIAFIGSWGARKGAKDWGKIIRYLREQIPEVRFLFLGTSFKAEVILEEIQQPSCDWIEIIPHFDTEELPALLSRATVGAFPSYIEGFGFAVLEKLATGLPTVVYDVPGPREMLVHLNYELMVPAGDVEAFCNKIIKLLKLDVESYSKLSEDCIAVAKLFSWSKIAQETLDIYMKFLEQVQLSQKLN